MTKNPKKQETRREREIKGHALWSSPFLNHGIEPVLGGAHIGAKVTRDPASGDRLDKGSFCIVQMSRSKQPARNSLIASPDPGEPYRRCWRWTRGAALQHIHHLLRCKK
jgi:hypothetical protein